MTEITEIQENLLSNIGEAISYTTKCYEGKVDQGVIANEVVESLFEIVISNSFFISIRNDMVKDRKPSYNKSEIIDKFSTYLDANVDRISKESEVLWDKLCAENEAKISNNIFNQN